MKPVIVGTAGHIDHGKTALVRALTGIDADRLDEEKRRGITIDLGFAHLELASPAGEPLRLGFIDVPGHERFVRNMLAGVGGIDLVLFVVAADEGIKPQTREHFDICRLLGIPRGITVLTKSDLVDRETLDVVRLELDDFLRGSFLAGAPIIPVSSTTGSGIDELQHEIARVAAEATPKPGDALFRLPVDRVFTMKGFGTVVTGTLISGSVRKDEDVEIQPSGKRARVRGVQVHGAAAEQARAGERTALNLSGVSTEELRRGDMLTAAGLLRPTRVADVQLTLLDSARPLRDRARVHLHAYSSETIAEVHLYGGKQIAAGESAYVQLRLPEPVLLLPGDRFIVRQFSPVITIGGGEVIANRPVAKLKSRTAYAELLAQLQRSGDADRLNTRIRMRPQQIPDVIAETGWSRPRLESLAREAGDLVRIADTLIWKTALDDLRARLRELVESFQQQNPLAPGMAREELRQRLGRIPRELFEEALSWQLRAGAVELAGDLVRLPGRGAQLKDEEAEAKQTIESAFQRAGLTVPALKDVLASLPLDRTRAQKLVTLLLRERVLVKVSDDLVFHRDALAQLRAQLATRKQTQPSLDVAAFKELTGVTRKYAIPLLEWLDRERVTRRQGDSRVIL